MHQNHLQDLLKHRFLDPFPRVSDSVGLVRDLGFCISNKLSGDTTPLVQTIHENCCCEVCVCVCTHVCARVCVCALSCLVMSDSLCLNGQ